MGVEELQDWGRPPQIPNSWPISPAFKWESLLEINILLPPSPPYPGPEESSNGAAGRVTTGEVHVR